MSCGAAVVGTDVDGIREVIRHNETGLLCYPTSAALHNAIRTLLKDSNMRKRLGAQARSYILNEIALERVVQRELAFLETLLD